MSDSGKFLIIPGAELRKLIAGKPEFGSLEALCIDLCGGVGSAGRMLHRLLGWWQKSRHPEGWVYKDYGDWWRELRISQKELTKANAALALSGVEVKLMKGRLDCPRKHYRLELAGFVKALARVLHLDGEWLKNFCLPFAKSIVAKAPIRNRQKGDSDFAKKGTPTARTTTASSMHNPQEFTSNNSAADAADFPQDPTPANINEAQEGASAFEEHVHHGEDTPTPSCAAPLPHEVQRVVARGLPPELAAQYIERYGDRRCIAAADHALRAGDTPPGMFRWILDQTDWYRTEQTSQQSDDDYSGNYADEAEVPDLPPAPVIDPERAAQWQSVFAQLEIQLDKANFETWLRDAWLAGFDDDDQAFVVNVRNSYARDMLTHRLNRTIQRVMGEVVGENVDIRYEVGKRLAATHEEMPLFKLLARNSAP